MLSVRVVKQTPLNPDLFVCETNDNPALSDMIVLHRRELFDDRTEDGFMG